MCVIEEIEEIEDNIAADLKSDYKPRPRGSWFMSDSYQLNVYV